MLNFTPEIERLGGPPALLARERREIFSIHPELRAVSWAGAVLIAAGAGVLLSKNLDRIGPVALAAAVAIAAAAAYGYAIWRHRSKRASLVDEYVLLLGALLLSADLAYIEGKFQLLDTGWPRHLLLLTFIHAAGAYYFGSRVLLSLSLVALAGWMGIERRAETFFNSSIETAVRAIACALMVLLWRAADVKQRVERSFEPVFEHFAANLALAGALVLTFRHSTRPLGTLLVLAFAAAAMWRGFTTRAESFALYAYAYAVLAGIIFVITSMTESIVVALFLIVSSIAAIVGLFLLHNAFRRRRS